jgi:hypothetical protein
MARAKGGRAGGSVVASEAVRQAREASTRRVARQGTNRVVFPR